MYTLESLNEVRSVDIVSVIGRYISLDKHNKACCPFHGEKTPSFSVSKAKQIFKCYGCGVGGDAISFVKKQNHCDFIAAVETIADFEGIALELERNFDVEVYKKTKAEKKSLKEIIVIAHNQFVEQLYLPNHAAAFQYWVKRGYSKDVISYWGLGFAPFNLGFLTRAFSVNGNLPEGLKLGLCKEKDNRLHQDVFINRVIIPILDEHGELVSFAGRIIEKESKYPKYINGSESPLYSKGKTLFGLYQAIPSILKNGFAILTEGYTDVITMHTAGATNTVGSCGTAFTEDQARLLKKYTDHVVLMRDADDAGEKAEDKDLILLLKLNFKVDIKKLPAKMDPDEYAKPFIVEFNEEDFLEIEETTDPNYLPDYNDRFPVDDEQPEPIIAEVINQSPLSKAITDLINQ